MGLKPYCKDIYGDETEAIDNTSYLAKDLWPSLRVQPIGK